jgi:hypothetical protein
MALPPHALNTASANAPSPKDGAPRHGMAADPDVESASKRPLLVGKPEVKVE